MTKQNNSMTTINHSNTMKDINAINGAGRKRTTKRSYSSKSTVQRSTKSDVRLKSELKNQSQSCEKCKNVARLCRSWLGSGKTT